LLVATPTTECRQATLGWSARDCRRATLAGAGDHHRVCLPRQLRPGWLSISVVLLFNTPSSVPVPVSVACIYLYSSCVRPLTSQSKESRRQRAGPAPAGMTLDESFKRPGTVPFKWEVQPGIPKQQGAAGDVPPPPTSPRLALPPAARVAAPLATPHPQPSHSHRRSGGPCPRASSRRWR
jgi:hypothetical protein